MTISHLLSTKFMAPRRSADHLARPQLVARLARAVEQRRFTLLSAPPGYGKTTLLVELIDGGDYPCAWLQIDAADGDPRAQLVATAEGDSCRWPHWFNTASIISFPTRVGRS